jgi:hypothetical protein
MSNTGGNTSSKTLDHYIRPVPPMYVTEYERAYTVHPPAAYIHEMHTSPRFSELFHASTAHEQQEIPGSTDIGVQTVDVYGNGDTNTAHQTHLAESLRLIKRGGDRRVGGAGWLKHDLESRAGAASRSHRPGHGAG